MIYKFMPKKVLRWQPSSQGRQPPPLLLTPDRPPKSTQIHMFPFVFGIQRQEGNPLQKFWFLMDHSCCQACSSSSGGQSGICTEVVNWEWDACIPLGIWFLFFFCCVHLLYRSLTQNPTPIAREWDQPRAKSIAGKCHQFCARAVGTSTRLKWRCTESCS